MVENMLTEDKMDKADITRLAQVIGTLAQNFNKLDDIRQLSTINLLMKIAFTRDSRDLVIPPMDDLKSEDEKPKKRKR